ncbi:MAG: acyl-CoA thioesterase [Desulfovibrionales bacterium]
MNKPRTSDFPDNTSDWHHRVSYGETDGMKVAYYGNYLHWFEQARSCYIRERGMSYAQVEEHGFFLPVREAGCRYRHPVRYDEEIIVRAGVSTCSRASITFLYEVRSGDGATIMASGQTQHACVDQAGKPVPLPDWLKALCTALPGQRS